MRVMFFEGIDGCGKDTLISNLKEYYEEIGKNVKVFNDGYHPSLKDDFNKICGAPSINNKERFLILQSIRAKLYQDISDYYHNNPDAIILVNRSIISSFIYQFIFDYFEDIEDFESNGFKKYMHPKNPWIEDENSEFYRNNFTIIRFLEIMNCTIPFSFHEVLNESVNVYLKVDPTIAAKRDSKLCDYDYSDDVKKFNNLCYLNFFYDTIFDRCEYTQNWEKIYKFLLNSSGLEYEHESFLHRFMFEIRTIIIDANQHKETVLQSLVVLQSLLKQKE